MASAIYVSYVPHAYWWRYSMVLGTTLSLDPLTYTLSHTHCITPFSNARFHFYINYYGIIVYTPCDAIVCVYIYTSSW